MQKKAEKDVFILGAGFSKAIGAPLQSELLNNILSFDVSQLQSDEQSVYQENLARVKTLIDNHMYLDPSRDGIDLEDIYTPLDNCIINNFSFRSVPVSEVVVYRRSLDVLITIFMKWTLDRISSKSTFVDQFTQHVVKYKACHIKEDRISFLTTNWDILLDNSFFENINNINRPKNGVVDYCCYVTQYDKSDHYLPGLMAKAKGMFNIKILKLHGSLNWLFCPRCGRLYATFNKKISVQQFISQPRCRLCKNNFSSGSTGDDGAHLEGQLLMPTYLKNFNNAQIKLIWQNAAVELSEATTLYFVGYSFPIADFELRALLSRNVAHQCKVVVVSNKDDQELRRRYSSFFGKRAIMFDFLGAETFFNDYMSNNLT